MFLFVINVTLQKCNPTFHSLRLTLFTDAHSLPGCENRMLRRCCAAYWTWRQIIWSDIICLRFSWHVASDSVHALSSVYSYTTASSHYLIQCVQTLNANTGWKAPAIPRPSEDKWFRDTDFTPFCFPMLMNDLHSPAHKGHQWQQRVGLIMPCYWHFTQRARSLVYLSSLCVWLMARQH